MSATAFVSTIIASVLPVSATLQPRSAAQDLGPLNAAHIISVTVHLKRPNEALFEKTVNALYDRTSPTYHQWLTDAALARFGPTAAQVATVRAELVRDGLTIESVARDGSSIHAAGTVAAVSRAFHTSIHQFRLNGKTFRANTTPATLSGAAGSYVSVVSGLESHTVKNMLARALNFTTKQPFAAIPLTKTMTAGGLRGIITDEILGPQQTFTFTTNGTYPESTFSALALAPNYQTLTPDYTPAQLQRAMGLTNAYNRGLNGAGQTIVLVEGYGYPAMLSDANAFSKLTGLPALNSSNFSVVYPEGVPNPQAGYLTGWSEEISLDIQWAHSIAPGAKILVVATNGQDDVDFEASMQYIIDNNLGNAVSDSWEEDTDFLAGAAEQESFEYILSAAASKGISFQFSTGDGGDGGLGTPIGAAGVPSVEPHATAVGGTAILNVPGKSSYLNLGWGDTVQTLDAFGRVVVPGSAFQTIFYGGGGGGSSIFWPKPAWQAALPGFYRQTPDVSALADPYTGVPIVTTIGGEQFIEVGIGGTSLASPIFTAIWAIAQQAAGHALGQAAPTVAGLRSGVTDVVPSTAAFSGSYSTSSTSTTNYTADSLFATYAQQQNYSAQNLFVAIADEPAFNIAVAQAFGFDSSLTVTPGWDNATGYGTPDGLNFIKAAASY